MEGYEEMDNLAGLACEQEVTIAQLEASVLLRQRCFGADPAGEQEDASNDAEMVAAVESRRDAEASSDGAAAVNAEDVEQRSVQRRQQLQDSVHWLSGRTTDATENLHEAVDRLSALRHEEAELNDGEEEASPSPAEEEHQVRAAIHQQLFDDADDDGADDAMARSADEQATQPPSDTEHDDLAALGAMSDCVGPLDDEDRFNAAMDQDDEPAMRPSMCIAPQPSRASGGVLSAVDSNRGLRGGKFSPLMQVGRPSTAASNSNNNGRSSFCVVSDDESASPPMMIRHSNGAPVMMRDLAYELEI
jgi:hypothetical protein